ncbi:MAG: AAA family ATPase [Nanoarchaeota archaeon]|nr:AAA family ATPase [Nanoarchaeota archaeon]MBU3941251.1 AAA family ATPase [Nanoarchaeota archaeon]
MKIVVSGTPGTGKSKFSKKLAKELKFKYLDIKTFSRKNKIYDKIEKNCLIIDEKKLVKELKKLKGNYVIDGHLSHYLKADYCVVCKCDLKVLKKRLEKRKYSKQKIKDNLDAEIFDVCFIDAKKIQKNVLVLDTSKGYKMEGIVRLIK